MYVRSVTIKGYVSLCDREDALSGSVICNVLNIDLLFIKFLCAISHDHLVLMDYIISDETCFAYFLTCYLDYVCNNWSAFTSSHHKLEDTMSKMTDNVSDVIETTSSSRKRKRHQQVLHASAVSQNVQQLECGDKHTTTKSLVAYDFSDSSEDDLVNHSILDDTMSCIIRLRLALERAIAKQIIINSQAPTKLVSMIEKVETLYENN